MTVSRICAWCGRVLEPAEWDDGDPAPSHTICDECEAEQIAAYDEETAA